MSENQTIDVNKAIELLMADGVVALPTETVYGLAGRLSSADALRKIFALKGRPADNPLIVHIAEIDAAESVAHVNDLARSLMKEFWPGPLTIVLPKRDAVSDVVTAGLDTVAVRMPDNALMREVIEGVGEPLAAPSANRSGRPSPTTAQHVIDDHGSAVFIVDGGSCEGGLESTIVRVQGESVVLLRPGAITREQISAVIGRQLTEAGTDDAGRSPGTRHRHYAPRAKMTLVYDIEALRDAASGSGQLLILSREDPEMGTQWRRLAPETLYATLRASDKLHVDEILVHCDQAVIRNEALMNRLLRAAESVTDGNKET